MSNQSRCSTAARRSGGIQPNEPLTIGEVAVFCRISTNKVRELCDSGQLSCYRVPGSTHRRVSASTLVAFLLAQGLSVPPELPLPSTVI